MKQQSKDPFEAAFEEQEDSPPESPAAAVVAEDIQTLQNPAVANTVVDAQEDDDPLPLSRDPSSSMATTSAAPLPRTHARSLAPAAKNKEDDDEEEEENVEVELGKFPSSGDPDKMAKMQSVLFLYCSSSCYLFLLLPLLLVTYLSYLKIETKFVFALFGLRRQ